jgi:uncharacterized membrane protein YfcA
MINPLVLAFLTSASFIAGAMNAVAGGGTLITFPALLGAGIPPVVANATSTLSLVPGSLTAMLGFRKDLKTIKHMIIYLIGPSLIGGLLGAKIMLWAGNDVLARLVPWLILLASTLFVLQEPLSRLSASKAKELSNETSESANNEKAVADSSARETPPDLETRSFDRHLLVIMIFQLFIAIYGGYFGAGIGILTLASLGFFGLTNIHQMNGLKNLLSASINLIATITFIAAGQINWPIAILMSCGAIGGGYLGAGFALKIGQKKVRQTIIIIGFGITAFMFYRQFHNLF